MKVSFSSEAQHILQVLIFNSTFKMPIQNPIEVTWRLINYWVEWDSFRIGYFQISWHTADYTLQKVLIFGGIFSQIKIYFHANGFDWTETMVEEF